MPQIGIYKLITPLNAPGDLSVYHYGKETCSPLHSWGPGIRDHYLVHYILEGKGLFTYKDVTYELCKGDGFLICPGDISFYQADKNSPWSYAWVGFHGSKAELLLKKAGLDAKHPVFHHSSNNTLAKHLLDMAETSKHNISTRDYILTGQLYLFLSTLVDSLGDSLKPNGTAHSTAELYLQKAVNFMHRNYSRKISIMEIAEHIGIDRKYLHHIFKKLVSQSPKEYLISLRMDKACELLSQESLSIGDIAHSIGYEDQLLFSRIFKKTKGTSPSKYRRRHNTSDAITDFG